MTFEVVEEPGGGGEVPAEIRRGIREADPTEVGPRNWTPLCVSLRDEAGAVAGGIYGATMWGWLLVDGLWVDSALRGRGLGTKLLLAAESAAIARGCRGAWLGTFDFQARGFYEHHGYRVCGELPDFPSGHTHYELCKTPL